MRNGLLKLVVVALALLPLAGRAEDEAPAAAPAGAEGEAALLKRAVYIPIKPPFVVNYGGSTAGTGRLHFMRAEVTLRVEDAEGGNSVRHHMPYIRNNLVLLFSAQPEETFDTQEGKEMLRQQALAEVAKVLEQEEGKNGVTDLYFNQLVVQK